MNKPFPFDAQAPNIEKKLTSVQEARVQRMMFEMAANGRFSEPYRPPVVMDGEPPVEEGQVEDGYGYVEPIAGSAPEAATPQPEQEEPGAKYTNADLAVYVKDKVIPKLYNWYHMQVEKIEPEVLTSFFNGVDLARESLSETEGRPVSDGEIYEELRAKLADPRYKDSVAEISRALHLMEALMNGYTKNGQLPHIDDIPE